MLRYLKRLLIILGLGVVLAGGAHLYAAWRLHSALVANGMSERVASCMTGRMVRRLNIVQLARLQKLEGEKPTLGAWVRAVKAVDDSEVVLVTTSSAALCKSGLAS